MGGGTVNTEMCYFEISKNYSTGLLLWGAFAKFRIITISFFKSVCLYVCIELASNWTDFHKISQPEYFMKIYLENSIFIKI